MSVDAYYKKMMLWLGVAFVTSVVIALIVVSIVIHVYGSG
jgi:hypothetical protein